MGFTPLEGVRILDLTSVVVGPSCTLRLADYGAEVIKLEPPEGDVLRSLGGPSRSGKMSGKYLHFNRRKRAICLDLKKPGALDALIRIADGCDVVVSNMRPEALGRLGLDAAALRARRTGLIHCTITGFGPGGPYRGRPAYDTVVQGVTGIAGLAARRDGRPAYAPLLLCDHVTGEIAAGAIMAALVRKGRTGEGAAIEVPMHETMAAFMLTEHLGPASFTPALGQAGDARVLDPGNFPLPTADGWIAVTPNTDAQVRGFLTAIGRADLIEDPRFRSVADRFRNARDWYAFRGEALRGRPTAEWLALFAQADVPAMQCHTLETIADDPHLAAVGLLVEETHPSEGPIRSIRPTVLEGGAPRDPGPPARAQGADTCAVLAEAGLDAAAIAALVEAGAALAS
ncbi:MAG: CoA transferase [Rhodospirillales bacterium]|nr:CoA transferase [Rhodospirillales bacterium]